MLHNDMSILQRAHRPSKPCSDVHLGLLSACRKPLSSAKARSIALLSCAAISSSASQASSKGATSSCSTWRCCPLTLSISLGILYSGRGCVTRSTPTEEAAATPTAVLGVEQLQMCTCIPSPHCGFGKRHAASLLNSSLILGGVWCRSQCQRIPQISHRYTMCTRTATTRSGFSALFYHAPCRLAALCLLNSNSAPRHRAWEPLKDRAHKPWQYMSS